MNKKLFIPRLMILAVMLEGIYGVFKGISNNEAWRAVLGATGFIALFCLFMLTFREQKISNN